MSKLVTGILLMLALAASPVGAAVVQDMYAAQVPVADQSSAELARGARLALYEVLVKVSGSAAVSRNPAVAAALGRARDHVERYSYVEDPADSRQLEVKMLFDSRYVTGLLVEAGAPIWTANRPLLLVWLVMEEAGERSFVNADTTPGQAALLREAFTRRGVPVQVPLYDLVDAAALNPDQVWALDGPAVSLASSRYNLQDVLAGHFTVAADGTISGAWSYQQGEEQIQRSSTAPDEQQFLREGADLVAEAMAARYAVAASANTGGLTMTVTGVSAYADYAAIVTWLEGLELVERANVESVRGETIVLRLEAQADASQLATLFALNKQLVPVGDPGMQLNYQWQR